MKVQDATDFNDFNGGPTSHVHLQETHSAPDVSPGAGMTLALPLLDAMVPAATALAQTAAVAEEPRSWASFSRTGWRRATGSREREGALPDEAAAHPRVAREGQGSDRRAERALVEVGRAAGGHDRFRSLGRRGVPDRHQAEEDRRVRRDRRQPDDRSDHRAKDRAGDAAAVAAAGGRGSELELEQLRRRATAAPTRTRSRGSTCRRRPTSRCRGRARCRWSSTRRWCSSACSGAARRRKCAPRACGRIAAFWIRCSASWPA